MLKNNAQAVIEDVLGKNPVTFDVNFDEEHKDCVKISIGNESPIESIVKYTDLFSFMFALGTKEQQAKMIPIQEEKGIEYMKKVGVRATKDIKEGEELIFNIKIHVPTVIEEQIRYELSQKELSPPSPYMEENPPKLDTE